MTLHDAERRYWAKWFGSAIRACGGECVVFWVPSTRRCTVRGAVRRAYKRLPPDAVQVGVYRLPYGQHVFAEDLAAILREHFGTNNQGGSK